MHLYNKCIYTKGHSGIEILFDNNIMVVYVLSVKTTEEVRIALALRQLKKDVATFNGHIFNDNL